MAFTLSGDDVCHAISPTPIIDPYWVALSPSAAELIGLPLSGDGFPIDKGWLDILAGNQISGENHQFLEPKATAYSGHQFGMWAGQLGDGRAILLGEIAGQELQLKGSGKTRYSRMGDGRAVLRSSIREFLCSEAMHALGIPTSRALSVVGSKQTIVRETLETAAVCARLAPSFIRVGHFEHFASLGANNRLKELADLLINDHYPECLDTSDPYLALFSAICKRNALLVAHWQAVGFCHGVLNTDNISALGLTIDYGPFGFLDYFQIDHICNHSDQGGRYAYHRQPQIMHWNMACLASSMLPLIQVNYSDEQAQTLLKAALDDFSVTYAQAWQSRFRQKLGLQASLDGDVQLIERLLQAMHDSKVDFTCFFRELSQVKSASAITDTSLRDQFIDRDNIDQWFKDYLTRLQAESADDLERSRLMNQVNPKFILRNHLAQVAIEKAQKDDFSEIKKLFEILSHPFDEQIENEEYSKPPGPDAEHVSVSCSS
jgi:serine/tyrosine/threonine adenylyltransferase